MPKLKLGFGDKENIELAEDFRRMAQTSAEETEELSTELTEVMVRLWSDTGVQAAFSRFSNLPISHLVNSLPHVIYEGLESIS